LAIDKETKPHIDTPDVIQVYKVLRPGWH